MSTLVPPATGAPRRARYLIPPGTPRRRELLACLTLAALLGGVLFAQVTFALAIFFHAVGRVSRWHPRWLALPAACGGVWLLAAGPAAALRGFTAVPRAVVAAAARMAADPAAPARLPRVPAQWLAGQLPVALIGAAALAAAAWWLGWLHTDEWDLPGVRPGPVIACRRWVSAGLVRSGGAVTRDGACLGVDVATGRPASVSWREARRGVLVTGSAPGAVSASGFQFVHAAIRRRQPVVVVDLADGNELAVSVAAACAATGAPLRAFGAAGNACYEPWRGGDPARRAALVMSLFDWAEAPEVARLACQAWLTEACAVVSAAPDEPGAALLDELTALLRPGALRARAGRVPSWYPGRPELTERVRVAVARLAADQAAAALLGGRLEAVRASPLGRWLRPAPGAEISLRDVVAERGVALFSLDAAAHGRTAALIADVVARDVAEIYGGLSRSGVSSDGLAAFSRCEAADPRALADLVTSGPETGLACVMTSTSPAAVTGLACQAGVLVVHRLADPGPAAELSWLTGTRYRPVPLATGRPGPGPTAATTAGPATAGPATAGPATAGPPGPPGPGAAAGPNRQPAVPAENLCRLGDGEFTLAVRGLPGAVPASRLAPVCRALPSRIPSRPAGRQP